VLQSHIVQSRHDVPDFQMLEAIRSEILGKMSSMDQLQQQAEELWTKYKSQEGFILAARKLYAIAQEKNKKYDLAFSYCQRAIITAEEGGVPPAPGLLATSIQVFYHWRVRRQVVSGTIAIDWQFLRDQSARLLADPKYAEDPLHRHIYALALAHLGKWSEAHAIYGQIRQAGLPNHVLWTPRDVLLNQTGGARGVQGVIRSSGDRQYLYVEDLGTDFHCDRNGRWPKDGEIAHAVIQFSFAGATAIDRL
jgi:tetratricopeptide (TPR) repeat protein